MIGWCSRCHITVIRDLPGRCHDKLCPPLQPVPQDHPDYAEYLAAQPKPAEAAE